MTRLFKNRWGIFLVASCAVLFYLLPAFAETDTQTINVIVTIPTVGGGNAGGGGGWGPGPPPAPTDTPPVVSDVSVSPSINTADFRWKVSDDKGISSILFQYGTTT